MFLFFPHTIYTLHFVLCKLDNDPIPRNITMYLAVSSTRVLFWLFVCLIKRKQLQLTSAEKKLITRKSRSQNQWKPRESGSRENQRRQRMMKILWDSSPIALETYGILIPTLHPHTTKLSTTPESSNLTSTTPLRVGVLDGTIWLAHSLTARGR